MASLVLLSHFDNNTNANDIETIIGGENGIWSRIQTLENELANAKHFRGAYNSMSEIYKISNPKPGDYAIWKRKNEEDVFVIYDETELTWREVGHVYQSAVTSVNGLVGDVIVNGDNIESSYDSSGNVKKISEIFKTLTSYINDHESDINLLIEQEENIQTLIDELEESITLIDKNHLEFQGDWVEGNAYKVNDIVKYGKHLYISQKDGVTSDPSAGLENGDWKIFVEGFSGKYEDLIGLPSNLVTSEQLEEAIGSIPTPDVSGQINAHNLDEEAHPYILEQLENLKNLLPTVTILEE